MSTDRPGSGRPIVSGLFVLILALGAGSPYVRAEGPPTLAPGPRPLSRIDPAIVSAVRWARRAPLRAVVSLRALTPARVVVEQHIPRDARVLAFFHAFRGSESDWTGGYVVPGGLMGPADQLARYESDHRAMLVTSIGNARAGMAAAAREDRHSWQVALGDLEARLDEFDHRGLMLHGYIVDASPRQLLRIARDATVRSADLLRLGRSTPLLPWEGDR